MTDEGPGTSQICLECGYVRKAEDEGPASRCPRCGHPYEHLEAGKMCHKCGYVRQTSDPGPRFACPKCGAVYAKVEQDGFWNEG